MVIQASTDLQTWIPLQTNLLGSGPLYFSDAQSTNNLQRFYRAQLAPAFTVGGTLTGLPAGDTVTLQDNGSDNLTLSTNGTFTFPTALPDGHAYSVTVSGTSGGAPVIDLHASERQRNRLRRQCDERCRPGSPRSQVTRTWTCITPPSRTEPTNGGVPAVMLTENGGPFRVTALSECSYNVALFYPGWAKFTDCRGKHLVQFDDFPQRHRGHPVRDCAGMSA